MRVVRRFPQITEALRDGRLSLSTIGLLGQVLTEQNFHDLVARAAYKTRAEVDHVVASLRPRVAPRDGIRRLTPSTSSARAVLPTGADAGESSAVDSPANHGLEHAAPATFDTVTMTERAPESPPARSSLPLLVAKNAFSSPQSPTIPTRHGADPGHSRASLRPVSRDEWSVRITIDSECKADLDMLQHLLSHKCGRDLASVLREAIRCAIEKHGRRRGAVPSKRRSPAAPSVTQGSTPTSDGAPTSDDPPSSFDVGSADADSATLTDGFARDIGSTTKDRRDAIPAAVRQAVYDRDGGCCSFVSADGRRCESKWRLEFDHVHPAFLGGPSTVENVRLLCRGHNVHHAELVFGRDHMEKFRQRYKVEGTG